MTVCRAFLCLSLAAASALPRVAAAQTGTDDILRELAALRAEVRQLRAELDALKAPQPRDEIVRTQLAELAQTKVESTSRFPVKLFGTIHAHAFANSGAANWLDIPNLVAPPVSDPGTFGMGLRQTRLGFTADGPALGGVRTSGVMAFDFFGGIPGFQTGQVMGLPRLLVAYARFDGARAAAQVGQDHVLLAPRDPTSLSGFAFPLLFRSGNLYLRAPHARAEFTLAPLLRVAGGVVRVLGDDQDAALRAVLLGGVGPDPDRLLPARAPLRPRAVRANLRPAQPPATAFPPRKRAENPSARGPLRRRRQSGRCAGSTASCSATSATIS